MVFEMIRRCGLKVFLLILLCALALGLMGFGGLAQSSPAEPTTVGGIENFSVAVQGQEEGSVGVSWTPAVNAQTHFVVYLKSADRAARNYGGVRMVPFDGSEGVIQGLEGGISYDFIAIGMRWNWIQFGTFWGSWSGWVAATPTGTGPRTGASSPAEPTTVGGIENFSVAVQGQEEGSVGVSWTPAVNAQTHFVVYLKSADRAARNYGGVRMVPFDGSEGVIQGLEGGISYDFIAIGMRWNWIQFGTFWGSWSGWVAATPTGTGASADRAALVALYNSTDGENWSRNTNWLSAQPLADWHGVTTDADGRLSEVRLPENLLQGELPSALGSLTNLILLQLGYNQLSGSIPTGLGGLANLETLSLENNQLSGSIPPRLGNLTNLETLSLESNQLSGTAPSELGGLINLETLSLESNQLSGTVPSELGGLINLETLSLESNQLSGTIPSELGGLANLEALSLASNQLDGSIPSGLVALTSLVRLDLSDNQLVGRIPSGLASLTRLKQLDLRYNRLSGNIPTAIGSLSRLTELYLSDNQLSGGIPSELANLSKLVHLDLSQNRLRGSLPRELGGLANLELLALRGNQLNGQIPAEMGNLSAMTYLDLSDNQLGGAIPAALGRLTRLVGLYLSGNGFTGCVPAGLRDVANNDLHGLELPDCGV